MKEFLRRSLGARAASIVSILDQGVASITSFILVVIAARLLNPVDFGAFSAVFVLYTIIVGAVQAYVGQELVLAEGSRAERVGLSWTAAFGTLVIALPTAAIVAVSGLVFREVRAPLIALAVALPVLLVQEVVRFAMSVLKSVHVALVVDVLRLVVLIATLATPLLAPQTRAVLWTAEGILALWAIATLVSLIPLMGSIRAAAHWGRPYSWRRLFGRQYLGYRFFWEFVAVRASGQGLTIVLGGLAGLAATGALRAASTLFGPINVLLNAVVAFAIPVLREHHTRARRRAVVLLTLGLCAVAALVTVVLLVLPEHLGRSLLGDTWLGARAVILPIGVQAVGLAVSTVMVVAIRMIDPSSTLPIRLVGAVLTVVLFGVGYVIGGVQGSIWGLCAASWVQAAMLVARAVRLELGQDADGDHRSPPEGN